MPHPQSDRRAAFETLYRATLPSIRSYARRRAPADIAEDVVAQTFLIAWRKCDEALAGGLPWLYRTASFTLSNHQRTERRQVRVAGLVTATSETSIPDTAEAFVDRSVLAAAINRLTEAEREILLLVYWEHLSVKAVAAVLGCRPGTAAVRLHRARRSLREVLSDPTAVHTSSCVTEATS